MRVERLVVGPLRVNCFLLGCEETREAVVIDPGGHPQLVLQTLRAQGWSLQAILATHAHFDHILAVDALRKETSAPFYLHPEDEEILLYQRDWVRTWMGFDPGPMPRVDVYLTPGKPFHLGCIRLDVAHTPGHSPGSVTFLDLSGKRAFVGDLIFAGGVGRTDVPGGDRARLLQSLQKVILPLPDDVRLLPGHGEPTTVGQERRYNPSLSGLASLSRESA